MTGSGTATDRGPLAAGLGVCGLLLLVLGGSAAGVEARAPGEPIVPGRIAHAGGAVRGATYTNSLEALERNYARGFRFFEIDFVWTSDGALVALHDWKTNFRRLFGNELEAPLSAAEFARASTEHVTRFTLLSLDGVLRWIASHPDTYLITDIKSRNLDGLTLIAKRRPQLRGQIIPQIYHYEEYAPVRALGYDAIIWTLYRQRLNDFAVVRRLEEMQLFAIAMPAARARRGGLGPHLERIGVPALAHTINDPKELAALRRAGVTEVYTDFLPPCRPPSPACGDD